MPEQWLSLTETARLAGLPELTARRYANIFDVYLPNRNFGRNKKYQPDAVKILLRIENLYREGYDTGQITDALSRELYTVMVTEEGKLLSTAESMAIMGRVVAEHSRVLQKLAEIMEKMAMAIQDIAVSQEKITKEEKTPDGCRGNRPNEKPEKMAALKWYRQIIKIFRPSRVKDKNSP